MMAISAYLPIVRTGCF